MCRCAAVHTPPVAGCVASGGDIPDKKLERDDRERDGSRPKDLLGFREDRGRAVVLVGRQHGRVYRPYRAVARAVALGAAPA